MNTMKNATIQSFSSKLLQTWVFTSFCSASGLAASWTVDFRCVEELDTTLDAGVKTWHRFKHTRTSSKKQNISKFFNIHLGAVWILISEGWMKVSVGFWRASACFLAENLWLVSYQVDVPTFSKLQVLLLVVTPKEAITPRPSSDAKIRHFKGLATSEQLS